MVDYSFIEPYTTSVYDSDADTSIVVTDSNGRINNSLLNTTTGASDDVNARMNRVIVSNSSGKIDTRLLKASDTPAKDTILKTSPSTNKLNTAWLDYAQNVSSPGKVVVTGTDGFVNNNLLNWTTGYQTNKGDSNNKDKLVKTSSTDGLIDYSLIKTTTAGGSSNANTIVRLDSEGKLDRTLMRDGWFIPLAGGEPTGTIMIQGNSRNASYQTLTTFKTKFPKFYGYGANAYTDGFFIGMNSSGSTDSDLDANSELILATHDDWLPIKVIQYGGTTGFNNAIEPDSPTPRQITLMDKANGYTTLRGLTVDTGNISVNKGTITTSGTGTNTLSGSLTVDKNATITGNVTLGNSSTKNKADGTQSVITLYGPTVIDRSTGMSGTSDARPALTIGGVNSAQHIEIDGNEIQSKSNATTPAQIWINAFGGNVTIGKDSTITLNKNVSVSNTLSVVGNTTIGKSDTKSTLKVFGGVTADNGLTVNNAVLTATKGATIKGAALDAQAGTSTTTLTASSTSTLKGNTTIGTSSTAANLVVYGTSNLKGSVTADNGITITNGFLTIKTPVGTNVVDKKIYTNIEGNMAGNDSWRIGSGTEKYETTGSDSGYGFLELAVSDDNHESIYVRQYKGGQVNNWDSATIGRTLTLLDREGNTTVPGKLTVQTAGSSLAGAVTVGSLTTGGISNSGNLTNTGTIVSTGKITGNGGVSTTTLEATRVLIQVSGDKVPGSNTALLVVGKTGGAHLEFDENEIQGRSGNSVSTLYLQADGGQVKLGESSPAALNLNGRFYLWAQNPSIYKSASNNYEPIKYMHPFEDNASAGNVFVLGGRGNTIVAGGEAAEELYDYTYNTNTSGYNSDKHYGENTTAYNNNGDHLYLIADQGVYVGTHFQGDQSNSEGTKKGAQNVNWYTFHNNGNLTIPGTINIGTKSVAQNGYIKFYNVTIQWGKAQSKASKTTVNFPIAFSNSVYSITASYDDPGDTEGAANSPSISGYSKTQVVFSSSNSYSNIYWIAIGY